MELFLDYFTDPSFWLSLYFGTLPMVLMGVNNFTLLCGTGRVLYVYLMSVMIISILMSTIFINSWGEGMLESKYGKPIKLAKEVKWYDANSTE